MRDLEATQSQLEDLRSIREKLEHDNRKLREEIKYLEDAQSKQRRPASGGRSDDQ
jgi:predicted phage gp36 major capsid-like protein